MPDPDSGELQMLPLRAVGGKKFPIIDARGCYRVITAQNMQKALEIMRLEDGEPDRGLN